MTLNQDRVSELAEFVGRLRLLDVRCVAIDGQVNEGLGLPPTSVDFTLEDKIDYGIEEGKFVCKYGAITSVLSESQKLAELNTKHVLIHSLEPGIEVSGEVIELYLQENGVFLVYPYIREVIQSTFTRFGLGNVVLNIIQRNIPSTFVNRDS